MRSLGEARLLRGHVAPLLDDGLLDRSGVGSGPGADLLGHIDTLLGGGELGHQLGHVLTGPLGLEGTGLLGGVLDNGLLLVITGRLRSRYESTAGGGTELPGLLGTSGDGGVLSHGLLGDAANLSGPLGALRLGGVSGGRLLALFLNLGSALDNIILDIVFLLLGPALGLVLGTADLGSLNATILDEFCSADIDSLVEGNLLVLNETALPEVLLALLLLLGVVVGDVGGVASPVVAMVALDHVIVLNLLDHLDLVNTSLSILNFGSGNIIEARGAVRSSLTLGSGSQILGRSPGGVVSMMTMIITMSMMITMMTAIGGVEGEGVDQRPLVSVLHSPELAGATGRTNSDDEKQLKTGTMMNYC